jgi:hypothetical protein
MPKGKGGIHQYLEEYEDDGSSPDLIKLYLNELRKSSLLSAEEERALAKSIGACPFQTLSKREILD